MDRDTERNEAGGRWGVVCMASYSYLALSPILTLSLACAWIIGKACTSFSTGLPLFKPLSCRITALLNISIHCILILA